MNLRPLRINWACPNELRNAKTKFMSEITRKKINGRNKTKLKKKSGF